MNTPSPQVASGFDPVTTSDRFVLLDALRALALVGVCFANLEWFTGYRLVPMAFIEHWPLVDKVTMQLSQLFIDGKTFGLFSLLFGVGFAVQLHQSSAGRRRLSAPPARQDPRPQSERSRPPERPADEDQGT